MEERQYRAIFHKQRWTNSWVLHKSYCDASNCDYFSSGPRRVSVNMRVETEEKLMWGWMSSLLAYNGRLEEEFAISWNNWNMAWFVVRNQMLDRIELVIFCANLESERTVIHAGVNDLARLTTPSGSTSSKCLCWSFDRPDKMNWPGILTLSRIRKSPLRFRMSSA